MPLVIKVVWVCSHNLISTFSHMQSMLDLFRQHHCFITYIFAIFLFLMCLLIYCFKPDAQEL